MKKHLYLMMGVAGSGKSTYAKNILKDGDIYISRDEIRYSLLTEEDDYFAKENEVIKEPPITSDGKIGENQNGQ